jgi:hypothetical protein
MLNITPAFITGKIDKNDGKVTIETIPVFLKQRKYTNIVYTENRESVKAINK